MKLEQTSFSGLYLIEVDSFEDPRGAFTKIFEEQIYQRWSLNTHFSNSCFSLNKHKGTIRGLHCQRPPYAEVKLIYCITGAVYDVVVDLRPDSSTYLKHFACELNDQTPIALYIPEGFAHGFQTLKDQTILHYHITSEYAPYFAETYNFQDPTFDIHWPLEPTEISDKDRQAKFFDKSTNPFLN